MHALTGGTVVDTDGARKADVLIEGDRIQQVSTDSSLPNEATDHDVSGAFIAPGLIDSHVHLHFDGGPDPDATARGTDFELAYQAAANCRAALEAGITTVRDLGSVRTLALDAGKQVESGVIPGPRVLACGQNVIMTGGHGNWFGREADGPAEVRKAVREQLARGADVIKCMATGGVLTEGAVIGAPELTPTELDALVETASARGVPTAAHAHGVDGIENAVRAGITSIEHGTFMDREAARLMAEKGTFWVPTASALRGIVDNPDEGIPDWAVGKAREATTAFEEAFEHAIDAGVTIAMGTDAGTPFNFHGESPRELEYLVERGLTPAAALDAATTNAAALLGLDRVGAIREGYHADLLVLRSNPIENASAWRNPQMVFRAGEQPR